ncbi:hypothetical protein OSTOST_18596 [Ostertagia ostertagi]
MYVCAWPSAFAHADGGVRKYSSLNNVRSPAGTTGSRYYSYYDDTDEPYDNYDNESLPYDYLEDIDLITVNSGNYCGSSRWKTTSRMATHPLAEIFCSSDIVNTSLVSNSSTVPVIVFMRRRRNDTVTELEYRIAEETEKEK